MSYIGNPIVSTDFPVDYFSGNGSTTAFTLSIAPASVNAVDIEVSGISQSPQTYTISGTTLTFSAAPPSGSSNIVVKHRGIAGVPNVPSAGSVTSSSLAAGNYFSQWTTNSTKIYYNTGNVGIGVSNPTYLLEVNGNPNFNSIGGVYLTCGSWDAIKNPSGNILAFGGVTASQWDTTALYTNGSERLRVTSGGQLSIGDTAPFRTSERFSIKGSSDTAYMWTTASSGNMNLCSFWAGPGGAYVGSITTNISSVSYSSASDYRLKEDVAPMTGALDKVAQLKPVTYTWKANKTAGQGFIAHELAEVIPDAVVGEKDAVDSDGNPKYQGVDTSFIVATLTAAIQELNAKVEAQAEEIAALKGTN